MEERNINLKKSESDFSDNFKPIYRKQPIKQSLPVEQTKKVKKPKKFFILAIVLVVGIVGAFLFVSDKPDVLFNNESIDIGEQIKDNVIIDPKEKIGEDEIYSEERDIFLKDNLANPRLSIRNGSGDEVIGLDHNGTIEAKNVNVTENLNVTGSGFFNYVGSLAKQVTKLWSTDIVTTDLNSTGNITIEGIKLEANQTDHFIYNNASCIIIQGSTSTEYIC